MRRIYVGIEDIAAAVDDFCAAKRIENLSTQVDWRCGCSQNLIGVLNDLDRCLSVGGRLKGIIERHIDVVPREIMPNVGVGQRSRKVDNGIFIAFLGSQFEFVIFLINHVVGFANFKTSQRIFFGVSVVVVDNFLFILEAMRFDLDPIVCIMGKAGIVACVQEIVACKEIYLFARIDNQINRIPPNFR